MYNILKSQDPNLCKTIEDAKNGCAYAKKYLAAVSIISKLKKRRDIFKSTPLGEIDKEVDGVAKEMFE